jgi:hypothetical protein
MEKRAKEMETIKITRTIKRKRKENKKKIIKSRKQEKCSYSGNEDMN